MITDNSTTGGITDDELAQQLYDVVMRDVEPDLLSYNLPKLAEFYKDETPAEHSNRMERYRTAYTKFEQAWRDFLTKVQMQVTSGQKMALEQKEASDRASEQGSVHAAATAIDSL